MNATNRLLKLLAKRTVEQRMQDAAFAAQSETLGKCFDWVVFALFALGFKTLKKTADHTARTELLQCADITIELSSHPSGALDPGGVKPGLLLKRGSSRRGHRLPFFLDRRGRLVCRPGNRRPVLTFDPKNADASGEALARAILELERLERKDEADSRAETRRQEKAAELAAKEAAWEARRAEVALSSKLAGEGP